MGRRVVMLARGVMCESDIRAKRRPFVWRRTPRISADQAAEARGVGPWIS